MRNKYKLAGVILLLLLLIGAGAAWHRHARTDERSTSMPASVSSPIATHAGPGPSTEEQMPTAPSAEPSGEVAAQSTDVRTDRAISMRGPAQPKAAGASKAKVPDPESPPVAAQAPGESNNRSDAGTVAEQPPEAAQPPKEQPPKEMGMLIGRVNNSVGAVFRLNKITYFVDGSLVATRDYPNGLQRGVDVQVFERPVDLGNHTLGAVIEYQGNGGGIFSYSEGYHYKISSTHPFTAAANTTTQITVVTYEKGGSTTSFENRLGVAFRVGSASGK